MNRKVLIVTYYWPPSGGSGVQRWLKFVKYLPEYQWEPHIFTPENPSFATQDPSLEKDVPPEAEVTRFPIWEPYDIFFTLSGFFSASKGRRTGPVVPSKNKTFFQRISTWMRGNFFVPDPRIFWVRPSVRFLSDYIARNGISIIITTGPPHSVHLIGLNLKKKYPHVRWLADFRDPWSDWGMWDSLMVTKAVRRIHKRMEGKVLSMADEIITITPFYVKRFEMLSGRNVKLLTNGYDEEDFKNLVHRREDKFTIRHVGWINEKCDPRPFMVALQAELRENVVFARDLRLEFIGEVHPDFKNFVQERRELATVTVFTGNVSHNALIPFYGSSSLFLLVLTGYKDAEGFLPGKLFEYLAAGIPVLGVGPVRGDAATLLKETGAGEMIASEDQEKIRRTLREAHLMWRNSAPPKVNTAATTRFSRRELTGQLAEILSRMLI